ncbi:type I-B CRISPR-associated protein Cas7/Csh2 [Halonatronum saccharophilum]|uniref:type I-B CRISPR-associated protein Cas7/Csh2 n=1 Tax=Halonatronum saccharophilum TaxID=150060 RepID=UPI000486A233|nr:type I-B CRISPR-associated protein Cas7/Csh2 [Halonatronum saccharophilum]
MTEKQKVTINNSEMLFLYDAKRCNPNGDMDNENKPRMDWDTSTNLVSDVRLKRYIRDFLEKVKNEKLFITNKAEDAKQRVVQLKDNKENILDLIGVRLFGAVTATETADHLTGPVQFNWGYSLNRVELQDTKTITSSFSSGEGVGKDYRVKYSFIAFSGGISGLAAQDTNLTANDIKLLDEAMVKAIPLNRTRSKIGQTPRFYLRVELKDNQSYLNDLREYIKLDYKVAEIEVREINQCEVDIDELVTYLNDNKDKVSTVHYWIDGKVEFKNNGLDQLADDIVKKELNY